jgi:hypothetical protein
MRKLLALLLLAVFVFPLASPLLAKGTNSSRSALACCKREGKHHCDGAGSQRSVSAQPGAFFTPTPEKCRYRPIAVVTADHNLLALTRAESGFALLVAHPSGIAQTESRLRIARDRSRRKRGPPASPFLA